MTSERLDDLLSRFAKLRIAVLGDFFVDKYLMIDPALAETSIETGLEAYQVVGVRCQPGAAGTVTNNLSALGVGQLEAVGYRGADGEGYELRRGLRRTRVETTLLFDTLDRFTPTYTKPLVLRPGDTPTELSRLDVKNRTATPPEIEQRLIEAAEIAASRADALIILDQVDEPDCGVVTTAVREFLGRLAVVAPDLVMIADSRRHIGAFQHVSVKPNAAEAAAAFELSGSPEELAAQLSTRMGRPVFVTLGEDGAAVGQRGDGLCIPGVPVSGPVDIVGAGDSFCAGTTAALAAGASPEEAAQVGCLVASLTVQQLGTTGTASPEQVRERLLASPYLN